MAGSSGLEAQAAGIFEVDSVTGSITVLPEYSIRDKFREQDRMIFVMGGAIILLISIVGGLVLANRKVSGQQRQLKILFFALYFWVLTFAQLILFAIGYSILVD